MIESLSIESVGNKPPIKKILKKLSKALESAEKEEFFEQINNLAEYVDQQPAEFWDKNNISHYLNRDSEPDSIIKWCVDKFNDEKILYKYRLREIDKKIDDVNIYHEIDFDYRTNLAQAQDQWKRLLKEKKWLRAVWISKKIEANDRVISRYKDQIDSNQKKKEQSETTLYLLRAMKRYIDKALEHVTEQDVIKII